MAVQPCLHTVQRAAATSTSAGARGSEFETIVSSVPCWPISSAPVWHMQSSGAKAATAAFTAATTSAPSASASAGGNPPAAWTSNEASRSWRRPCSPTRFARESSPRARVATAEAPRALDTRAIGVIGRGRKHALTFLLRGSPGRAIRRAQRDRRGRGRRYPACRRGIRRALPADDSASRSDGSYASAPAAER